MSDFIVDASVAVKWLVAETDSLVADELSASNHQLFAPHPILTEVANAQGRKARCLDAQLVTADRKFTATIAGTDLPRHVTLLSDWRPE